MQYSKSTENVPRGCILSVDFEGPFEVLLHRVRVCDSRLRALDLPDVVQQNRVPEIDRISFKNYYYYYFKLHKFR